MFLCCFAMYNTIVSTVLACCCFWTVRLSESSITTDQQYYEVAEFEPFSVNVKVDERVTLPKTFSLIQESDDQVVTIKSMELEQFNSTLMVFERTTRTMAGTYMFAGYDHSRFEVKILYLDSIHIRQSTLDDSHVTYVECSVVGFPKPNITWTKFHNDSCFPNNDVTFDDETVQHGPSSFKVTRKIIAGKSGNVLGQFTCTVNNKHSSKSRSLLVHDPKAAKALSPSVTLQNTGNGLKVVIFLPGDVESSSTANYQVDLHSVNKKSCSGDRTTTLKHPNLQFTFENLCPDNVYRAKVTAILADCSAYTRITYDGHITTLSSVTTIQAGTVASIVLSALLGIVLILFVCSRLVHQRKSRRSRNFEFLRNQSASSWSVALDRNSSFIELPDNSGYLAASDVTASPEYRPRESIKEPSPVRSHRIPIEEDYAIPYTPKDAPISSSYATSHHQATIARRKSAPVHQQLVPNRYLSVPSLKVPSPLRTPGRTPPRRSASVFLPDGSGYAAAGARVQTGGGKAVRFAQRGLSVRREAGRPLSLDISLARKAQDSPSRRSDDGNTGDHVYATIQSKRSPGSGQRPTSTA